MTASAKKCRHDWKTVSKGKLKWDKDHLNDKQWQWRTVKMQCKLCQEKRSSQEYPYLLSDIFSI